MAAQLFYKQYLAVVGKDPLFNLLLATILDFMSTRLESQKAIRSVCKQHKQQCLVWPGTDLATYLAAEYFSHDLQMSCRYLLETKYVSFKSFFTRYLAPLDKAAIYA
jgi:hypothetical protein